MSVTYKTYLIAGISLSNYFEDIYEDSKTFDEHDIKGNKTGKKIRETKIMATLPNGGDVIIGERDEKSTRRTINYNFYKSIGFDGDFSDETTLGLHYDDYETQRLENYIIGKIIGETEEVLEIDELKIESTKIEVQKELQEKFGYYGEVKLYLIQYVSY